MMFDFSNELAPGTYFDPHFKIDAVKILPGEYYVTPRDIVIVTVLGSCVSVCLRDRTSGIGGMNHFMLPGTSDEGGHLLSTSARYGVYAIEILINHLLTLGAQRRHFEAKVFGGASVLRGFGTNNVGKRNAEFVLDYLHTEGIPVVAQDLLDTYPRKVYFFPSSGKVMLKKLKSLHNTTLLDREMEYSLRIKKTPVCGEIDLF